VKVLGVILETPCYNTKLVYILLKQLKFKIVFKHVKEGMFVLLNAAYMHPVLPAVTF